MISKHLRFACPSPQDADEKLERFISAKAEDIHNPWPELVDPQALHLAFTNPIMRVWYIPTTDPGQLYADMAVQKLPLRYWVAMAHEAAHYWFDRSPAKEEARLAVAYAFYDLIYLFALTAMSDDPTREKLAEVWVDLHLLNEAAATIFEHIELAEELLATAFGFRLVEQVLAHNWQRRHELPALEQLETEWVGHHGELFQRIYAGGFKKAVALAFELDEQGRYSLSALARLSIYLEPTRIEGHIPEISAIQERCERLAQAAQDALTLGQLLAWLGDQIPRDELVAWHDTLKQFVIKDNESSEYTMKRFFWELSKARKWRKGGDPDAWAARAMTEYVNHVGDLEKTPRAGANALLFPVELADGRWQIKKRLLQGGERIENYDYLVSLEGIRQQIAVGHGFQCPFRHMFHPDVCTCAQHEDPDLYRIFQRLADWAAQGYLAPVQWRLHPPCASGTG